MTSWAFASKVALRITAQVTLFFLILGGGIYFAKEFQTSEYAVFFIAIGAYLLSLSDFGKAVAA